MECRIFSGRDVVTVENEINSFLYTRSAQKLEIISTTQSLGYNDNLIITLFYQ